MCCHYQYAYRKVGREEKCFRRLKRLPNRFDRIRHVINFGVIECENRFEEILRCRLRVLSFHRIIKILFPFHSVGVKREPFLGPSFVLP